MKKILCIALSLIMTLGLVACGADKPAENNPNIQTPNIEEQPTYQEPIQSAKPIGPAPTDEETMESPYKYESVVMQQVNVGMDGKIRGFSERNTSVNLCVILGDDGRLYWVDSLDDNTPTDYNRTYTFDSLKRVNNWNGGTMAIREEYKVHIEGSDKTSFYYNPEYEEMRFESIGSMGNFYGLHVLSKDSTTGDLIFQRCLLDGTINEHKIQLRAVTPETRGGSVWDDEYMDESLEGKKYFFTSIDHFFAWGEDGQILSYNRDIAADDKTSEENNHTQYYTLSHLGVDASTTAQLNSLIDLNDLLIFDSEASVYTRKSDTKNIYQVVDKNKKESLTIALPEGYTTDDIQKVHYHANNNVRLLIEFDDGHICYSTADNKSTLILVDGVDVNQHTLSPLQYIENEFIILMDDGNIYKLMLH